MGAIFQVDSLEDMCELMCGRAEGGIGMKYNFKIWENHKKVVLEGTTSGRGTRKEQEEEARLIAMKAGYKTRLDERYSLQMKATTLY